MGIDVHAFQVTGSMVVSKKMAEQYEFLKEGDVLTDEFIKSLDKDEQEQCHQLNRRTEFQVLRTTYKLFE